MSPESPMAGLWLLSPAPDDSQREPGPAEEQCAAAPDSDPAPGGAAFTEHTARALAAPPGPSTGPVATSLPGPRVLLLGLLHEPGPGCPWPGTLPPQSVEPLTFQAFLRRHFLGKAAWPSFQRPGPSLRAHPPTCPHTASLNTPSQARMCPLG